MTGLTGVLVGKYDGLAGLAYVFARKYDGLAGLGDRLAGFVLG
ncbi:hypothetical protein [Labilibacter marinus]|nr:hypothetical protein [Labilibacter marinus]